MAYSINKVILVGTLGADPEVTTIANGTKMAKVSLATHERYKDKHTEEWKENTHWHRLVFWDKLAETAGQWLKKGAQIYVEGSIKYGQYQAQDGTTRYTTDISVREMVFLGHRNKDGASSDFTPNYNQPNSPTASVIDAMTSNLTPDLDDDDIPF